MANAERMEAQLKALSLISEQGEEGTTRLSYTPEYRKGADYIKKLMEEAGLTVREDAAASLLPVRLGNRAPSSMGMATTSKSPLRGFPLSLIIRAASRAQMIPAWPS